MDKLIFFDINGTIIKRDKRTDIPYSKAVSLLLNRENPMEGVDTSARSDKDVLMEVLQNHDKAFNENIWSQFLDLYKKQLEKFKSTDVWRENADAISFIEKLSKKDYNLSLITGELSIGAKYKLEKLGVWKYFPTGGFGEDGLKRFDIAEAALEKSKKIYNEPSEIYIIGDTTLDIKTARHLGAKVISITTGSNTREELERENPDYLIDSFNEIEGLFL
ncbi:HAD family hydrolase [Dethiothermospora halolimnae]|uniref:HAD family hydrolase n=1 Tax=Dethiothermospora halolimnae TaxID=3114390 RepID=UPI003CCBD487